MVTILSGCPRDTEDAGRRLVEARGPGTVFALVGELGAGKTHFVRGMCEGLGGDPGAVSSPTFTLVHEYAGTRTPFVHMDWYRIESAADLLGAGLDEYFDGKSVVAVEWADRFPELVPPDAIWARFEVVQGTGRRMIFGPRD